MNKKTKIIILIVAILIVAAVFYFLFKKPKVLPTLAGTDNVPATITPSDQFPFTEGAQGDNVRRLQVALNWIKPQNPILADGKFGPSTRNKLLTTVSTQLSMQPVTQEKFNQIIAMGNQAKKSA